jgi:hypothetical protein
MSMTRRLRLCFIFSRPRFRLLHFYGGVNIHPVQTWIEFVEVSDNPSHLIFEIQLIRPDISERRLSTVVLKLVVGRLKALLPPP